MVMVICISPQNGVIARIGFDNKLASVATSFRAYLLVLFWIFPFVWLLTTSALVCASVNALPHKVCASL